MEPIEILDFNTIRNSFNLAGVIPVAGYQNEYENFWPDYLHPINKGYYPLHKSVLECAYAGCDTIWVVCNYDHINIVKELIGESVIDPATFQQFYINKSGRKMHRRKIIPIMYIGMDMKYLLNCTTPFSALYGAYMIKKISHKLSKWIKPDRYFFSFLNQHYNIKDLYDIRSHIKNENPFFVSHNSKTILDDIPSAFTIDNKDLYNILKWSKIKNNFSYQQVFGKINSENSYIWEPKYCFDIKTWDGLREYMGSPLTKNDKVINSIFIPFKFRKLYNRERKEKNGNV
jgi:hypothetical protein